MPPTAQQHSRTKTSILDAAQREFAHFGFRKVTMDEIAQEVGLGKASLYYYFPTKELLFQAVVVREHESFIASTKMKLRGIASAKERVMMFVRERSEYFNRLLHLNILDLRSSTRMKPMFAEMFENFSKEELKLLRTIISSGRERGEFRFLPNDRVAEALLHTMQGLRVRFLRLNDHPRIEPKQFEKLKEEQCFVTEIFLRGIQK